jgi:hypothetical protein
VVAVEQRGQRRCRDVLDEARQQATEDRRPRQAWLSRTYAAPKPWAYLLRAELSSAAE